MKLRLLILFALMFVNGQTEGHPMPNSIVNLSIFDQSIHGEARIPIVELGNAVGDSLLADVNSPFFLEYFAKHIVALSGNHFWKTEIQSIEITTDHDPMIGDYQEVVVHFKMVPPDVRQLRHFVFQYDAVIHQVITHSIVVFVQYDWSNGIREGSASLPIGVISLDVPTGKINPLQVDLEEGSGWKGFISMIVYGMQHIREGLDHILFLLTLLLVAPLAIVNKKWSDYQGFKYALFRFLKISVSFTLGHSVTLLIGAFNLVDFRVQYIEVLITFTILISAVNSIKPIFFNRETILAGVFGLIHGLAFSISLSHLDLDVYGKLISVLGFNLGIEAMQLIIMACFFPLLLVSKWKWYSILRYVFAIGTIVISIGWMIERITNKENIVTQLINQWGFA